MDTVISREKVYLSPGTLVRMQDKTWQDYQRLRQSLGDRPLPRLKYRPGELLLMSPLPKHGFVAALLADIAKVLLDHCGREYLAYTPLTMELPEVSGIEPDYCFYVEHCAAVLGRDRMNWQVDPPPDLVIEVDVTSYTDVADYLPYQVPEVWLWKCDRLQIHCLQAGSYCLVTASQFFPEIDVARVVSDTVAASGAVVSSRLIRSLRQQFPPA